MTPNAKLTEALPAMACATNVGGVMTDTNSPSSDVAALLAEADDHGLGHRLVHSLAAALRDSERIRQAETKNANYLSVRLAASEAERERLQRELDGHSREVASLTERLATCEEALAKIAMVASTEPHTDDYYAIFMVASAALAPEPSAPKEDR